jgi:hypothetical protein
MNDLANPDWANYAMEQKRRKLQDELRNKAKNQQGNSALNENLPKKFVSKKEINAGMQNPAQPFSKPKKSSKIEDAGQIATTLPPFVKTQPSESLGFGLTTPETAPMNLPPVLGEYNKPSVNYDPESLQTQPSAIRDNVTSYIPNEPRAMSAQPIIEQPPNDLDFRSKLYEYLRKKISGDPMDADRLSRMNKAREYAAANQFGASLADSASKMGTLQGKRSEVGNFQPLIESIYERDMGKIGDELALEKQREESLLRGANLSSKLLKSTGPKPPKLLPYYRPSTGDQPGEILMYDEDGNLIPRQLPPGYKANNPWSTLPPFVDASGKPVFIQQDPVTGETRKLDLPNDLRSLEQVKMATQQQMKEIDNQMKTASQAEKNELMRERMRLSAQMSQIRQKELDRKIEEQRQKDQLGRARFEQEKKTQDWRQKNEAEKLKIQRERASAKAVGAGPAGVKITEAQGKAGAQANVAVQALGRLEAIEETGYKPGVGSVMRGAVGVLAPPLQNYITPEVEQTYQNATKALVDQLLRFSSGAAIGEKELSRMLGTYAIIPGDKPETKKQKSELRRAYVQSVINAAGPAGSGMELPQQQGPRKVIKKFHDKVNNKTKFIYNYGEPEVVNGLQ